MTTELATIDPGAPLQHASALRSVIESKEASGYRRVLNHAWPGDLDPQRRDHQTQRLIEQAQIAIATSERPDAILKCCFASVIDTLHVAASLNLSVQKSLGEAYFVPFAGVLTLMVGYRGFIKLLVNTGYVTQVASVLVYEGEPFAYRRDEHGPHWEHSPDLRLQGQADKVVGCYAVGYTRGGPPLFEVMNADELGKVKACSASVRKGIAGPYTAWPTEMMRKAPIRRLQKYIPKTADNQAYELLAKAAEHDNQLYDLRGYEQAQKAFMDARATEKSLAWAKRADSPAGKVVAKALPISSPDAQPPADLKNQRFPDDPPEPGSDG